MRRDSHLDTLRFLQAKLSTLPAGIYIDRQGNPCRHPSGLYATSRAKVFRRMQALTEAIRVEKRPEEISGQWPTVMSVLGGFFVAVDSHADDLKTIIFARVPGLSKRAATNATRLIDEIFEDLVGRPYSRVRHNGETLEMTCCFDVRMVVYGLSAPRNDGAIAPYRLAHGSTGSRWSYS